MDHVIIGDNAKWLAEKAALPMVGTCYQSEALCQLQIDQADRGYVEAELVRSAYGWCVRYRSGLQSRAILFNSPRGEGTPTPYRRGAACPLAALEFATKWVAVAPTKRACVVSAYTLASAQRDGDDVRPLQELITT